VPSETPLHPGALLALLADETRLRCLSAVVLGATSEAEVAVAAGLPAGTAGRALGRLVTGGLVAQAGDGGLSVLMPRLREAAKVASHLRVEIRPEDLGAGPEQASVMRGFFDDGRLVSIPVQRAKRLVVLDFLAQQFDPGKTFPEREVNAILGRFYPDYAALRRYLVDEEFLERREGFYWRAGGSFRVE
jgi:hypothetical protein